MAEENKEEPKIDFNSAGEAVAYISLDQARVLALQHARDNRDVYGRYARSELVWDVVSAEETEDYYEVSLSYRPAGDFRGRPGVEHLTIDKTGPVGFRQIVAQPRPSRRGLYTIAIAIVVLGATLGGAYLASTLILSGAAPFASTVSITPDAPASLVSLDGGVIIDIDANTVNAPSLLTYEPLSPAEIPALPENFSVAGKAFDLTTESPLLKPITITVGLSAADATMAAGNGDNIVIQHHQNEAWTPLVTTVDFGESTATAQADSLSIFALTVRQPEPTPIPTHTPEPKDTAIPADTPTTAPSPTPESTSTPIAIVTRTLLPTPTPVPTATPTPVPTPTSTPVPSPSPIPAPTATSTPAATVTPAITLTPTPSRPPTRTPIPRYRLFIEGLLVPPNSTQVCCAATAGGYGGGAVRLSPGPDVDGKYRAGVIVTLLVSGTPSYWGGVDSYSGTIGTVVMNADRHVTFVGPAVVATMVPTVTTVFVALTPTPTSTPIPVPVPTAAPIPNATAIPSPTLTVTPVPIATPTPIPTATPTPTPTPLPTATAVPPTPTSFPTATPVPPTPTPLPTATPVPPTPTPTPTPPSGPGAVPAPAGLVSWWPGDGNANDIVDGNNATLHGNTAFTQGMVGQSFIQNAYNDFISVPGDDNANLNITGDVTIDLWAKRSVIDSTDNGMIVKATAPIGPAAYVLFIRFDDELSAYFRRGDASYVSLRGPTVTDTDFHHYAYVRNGASHRLLMDGSVVASGDFTGVPGDTSGFPLVIGGFPDPSSQSGFAGSFNGLIDEVEIFNRALSDAEIQSIFNAGSSGKIKP